MDKMREEFEKILSDLQWEERISKRHCANKSGDGEYISDDVDDLFEMFKASRAALVVELPEYVADSAIRNGAINEFKIKLDKADIKYE